MAFWHVYQFHAFEEGQAALRYLLVLVWIPHFGSMRFPLDGEFDFYLKKIDFYWLFENDLESPLIFVLFLKGKQNKKEKP